MSLRDKVLILYPDGNLKEVGRVLEALSLVNRGVVQVLRWHEFTVSTITEDVPCPSVLKLKTDYVYNRKTGASKANIMARDNYTCQYCGYSPARHKKIKLTIDHIVPRSSVLPDGTVFAEHVGMFVPLTSWHNCVTACSDCNRYKGDRDLKDIPFKLLRLPTVPTMSERNSLILRRHYRDPGETDGRSIGEYTSGT